MTDLNVAFRQLLRNPGFAAVAVLTLALGIGVNTAIFSVIHGVLLKPLPYPQPERLMTLWERAPERGIDQDRVSGPNYLDWREQNSVFSDLAVSSGWDRSDFKLVVGNSLVRVHGGFVSSSLFTTLGGAPLLGRVLLPDEDQKEGHRAAVLGYGLWQRHFGGTSNILGQTITVENYGRHDYTVVGVMPPEYGSPGNCELWLPLGWMGVTLNERRSAHLHNVIARLKPGISPAQAEAEMNAIQARLKETHPAEIIGSQVAIVPLVQQAMGRNFHTTLLVLWGVVTGVLLIACANVANLQMARAVSRQREIAVRIALGAGRWRVIRQLLTESMLISLLGGGAGLLLGHWGMKLFVAVSPKDIPRLSGVSLDGTALLFTFGIALLTGLIFGLVPAWHGSGPDLNEALKSGGRAASAGVSSQFTRNALVVVEAAITTILLIGAGLMLQSFGRLLATDRGFRAEQTLTAELDFSVTGFGSWIRPDGARPQVYLKKLLERVRELPGVQSAGAAYRFLRSDSQPPGQTFTILGRPFTPEEGRPTTEANALTPGYLRALGIPLLHGRDFSESDTLEAPGVVLVNESFARRFFPGEDPLGKFVTLSTSPGPLDSRDGQGVPFWFEIAGVVGDVKSLGLPLEAVPEIFWSCWQWPMQTPTLAIRAAGAPSELSAAVQREIKSVVPGLPVPESQLMTERVSQSLAQPRFASCLLGLFGGLALVLAACGVYGVLAYSVAQRQRELGVRLALGAERRDVLSLVLKQGMKLTWLGVGVGWAASLGLSRVLQTLLFEIRPTDPLTFATIPLVLIGVALLASWLPARRAARVDPMEALRSE